MCALRLECLLSVMNATIVYMTTSSKLLENCQKPKNWNLVQVTMALSSRMTASRSLTSVFEYNISFERSYAKQIGLKLGRI
mmetsp:Transcript_24041/g.81997  ORF Transcript_24041/g.81997 Transcript_24041/m.81997 type:complete len:81 (-) Transcript_24041:1851-2093(-)